MTERHEAEIVAETTSFATLGVLTLSQTLAQAIISDIDEADRELVAEESLSLISVTTARALEIGMRDAPETAAAVLEVISALPETYSDYLLGGAVLAGDEADLVEYGEEVSQRVARKREFYEVHFARNKFPTEQALTEKMGLWMGRVSPPNLSEMPDRRLARLQLVVPVLNHLRVVLAYSRKSIQRTGASLP